MKSSTTETTSLPFLAQGSKERRILSLEPLGFACIPRLAYVNFTRTRGRSRLHRHPGHLEISYCLRGHLAFETGGRDYPFLPGSLFVAHPSQAHHIKEHAKNMSTYDMFLRIPAPGERFLGLSKDESAWFRKRLLGLPRTPFSGTEAVRTAFQRLFTIVDTSRSGSMRQTLALRIGIADLLLRVLEASEAPPRILPDNRIRSLIEEMRQHPERKYPQDELVRRTALSPTNLANRFKKHVGLPPNQFLISCRIEKAKTLLADGTIPVAAVADRTGFATARHFTETFKSATGRAPSVWRDFQGLTDARQ